MIIIFIFPPKQAKLATYWCFILFIFNENPTKSISFSLIFTFGPIILKHLEIICFLKNKLQWLQSLEENWDIFCVCFFFFFLKICAYEILIGCSCYKRVNNNTFLESKLNDIDAFCFLLFFLLKSVFKDKQRSLKISNNMD